MDPSAREKARVQTMSEAPLAKSDEAPQQSGLFSGLSFAALWKATGWIPDADLSAAESASTLYRVFRSKHVRDLKLILTIALIVCLSHVSLVLLIGLINAVNFFLFTPEQSTPLANLIYIYSPPKAPLPKWEQVFIALSEYISFMFRYIGPGIPIYGIIIAWAYQSASKRLGIIDLFACEIGTLCRVGTIFDIGKRYVDGYFNPEKSASSGAFVSKEEYFPVFENNSRDLELLEATVVNYITEFYTYMKALRDAQRRLGETKPPEAAVAHAHSLDAEFKTPWHLAMLNVIYLMYLGYESARKAIRDLVEYQPARAERLIVILLTELKCYAFLRKQFKPEDLRWQRLQLREEEYREQVIRIYDEVTASHQKHREEWIQAEKTLPELESRYKEALGEDLVSRSKRRTVPFTNEGEDGPGTLTRCARAGDALA